MLWLFAQMFVLCAFAFVAGAVLTWLPLRTTIRDLRAERAHLAVRPALPATAVIIPEQPAEPHVDADIQSDAESHPAAESPVDSGPDAGTESGTVTEVEAEPVTEVKGSTKSMIFHTASSPYFRRMKGDVTFRSVEEAERAGYTQWRPRSAAAATT
ncbi:hypothetical protein AB0I60_07300 [Actinosynnema sp. NPDC050436]|uniref:sunset domain-containing protein n=1 Tax=Actinosynnema sp. NPDC050436 TaxID=3155659 RepID=UPI00340AA8E7